MTAQEIHEDRLRKLHCCIAEKAVEMSDYMSLGSKKAKCKLEDLELLNAYYDILLCHVPYDCADVCGTEVCCNIDYNEDTMHYECVDNCLSDEQYDAVWEWIASKCDCLGLERSDESLVIGDKAFEDGECFEFEDDDYYQFD